MNDKEAILLYDSECGLCNRFKKALEFLDTKKRIEFRSIHETEVYVQYPELDKDHCLDEIHLIDKNKKIYRGGEVIEFLIKIYPGVEKIAWLLDSDSAKRAMDAFYGRLNDMRIMKKRKCYTCGSSKRTKRTK